MTAETLIQDRTIAQAPAAVRCSASDGIPQGSHRVAAWPGCVHRGCRRHRQRDLHDGDPVHREGDW